MVVVQSVGPAGHDVTGPAELLGLMVRRRSARVAFDPDRMIPPDDLRQVLEAARWAPTAHNMQNYDIIVVDDPRRLQEIAAIRSEVSPQFIRENFAQLSFSEEELRRKKTGILATMFPPSWLTPDPNPFETADPEHSFLGQAIQSAPVLLVVVYDSSRRAPASEGDALGMMSLGSVMQNMWLMASALGISMQIVSAMSGDEVEQELRKLLHFPPATKVAFGARLGYAVEEAAGLRVRRDVEDFAHRNSFSAAYR